MKKLLIALVVLLSLSVLVAASLTIGEGNIDSISVYAPDGTMADPAAGIDDSGYLIRSSGKGEVFTSPFGDIHLNGESAVVVTDFTIDSPSLYIIEGDVSIVLTEDLTLAVYTPTTLTTLPGKGEYRFSTNTDEETFLNLSENTVTSYDAITATETEIASMSGINRTVSSEQFPISADAYYNASVVDVMPATAEEPEVIPEEEPAVVPEEPEVIAEEEPVATPEEEVEVLSEEPVPPAVPSAPVLTNRSELIDTFSFDYNGYTLTILIGDGYADLLYPSVVTRRDAESFFAYEMEKYGSAVDGITYSFIDGGARLNLPSSIDRETAKANAEPI